MYESMHYARHIYLYHSSKKKKYISMSLLFTLKILNQVHLHKLINITISCPVHGLTYTRHAWICEIIASVRTCSVSIFIFLLFVSAAVGSKDEVQLIGRGEIHRKIHRGTTLFLKNLVLFPQIKLSRQQSHSQACMHACICFASRHARATERALQNRNIMC